MHFASLLVAAAVGVNCHPSGHNHRSFHAKRGGGELVTATINGKVVTFTNSPWKVDKKPEVKAPEPTPTSTKAAEPAATNEPSKDTSSSPGQGASSFEGFCGGKTKRAPPPVDYSETSLEDIQSVGNTGKCFYGSNIKLIASESAMKGYKYGAKVTGGSKKLKCGAYNKIAPTGLVEGFYPKHFAKNFEVAANAEQWLAFEDNFHGGVICSDKDELPVTWTGLPTATWAELGFGDMRNTHWKDPGWSAFDASGLVAADNNVACAALKVCALKYPKDSGIDDKKRCSTINAGMACDGTNAYTKGTNNEGGLGTSVPPFGDGESLFLSIDYS